MKAFILWHSHEENDDYGIHDEVKLLGVFSTLAKANESIDVFKDKEGFRDYPLDCFTVEERDMDIPNRTWTEGFVSVRYAGSDVVIRPVRADDDREEISNIFEQSWKMAYEGIVPEEYMSSIPAGEWAGNIDDPDWKHIVCELDGKLIGTASVCRSRFEEYPDAGEIVSIYMLPEYTGKGYGKLLLNEASKVLKYYGFNEIFLWVLEDNKNARRFYESQGFSLADGTLDLTICGKPLKEVRYVKKTVSVEI